jgi:hypothetical protein
LCVEGHYPIAVSALNRILEEEEEEKKKIFYTQQILSYWAR